MNPFSNLKTQLTTSFKGSGIKLAIGGFDISFNEHEAGLFRPHWKPHAWLFVLDGEFLFGDQRFRNHFPKDKDTVPKPVEVNDWDGNLGAITYALKGQFQRRITLAPNKSAQVKKKRRNARYRDLRAKQKVELLIALDRIGLHRRLVVKGAELIEDKGEVTIKRVQRDSRRW